MAGKLVIFEGADGCGKSTQARNAYDYLHSLGLKVNLFRDPGQTVIGEKIRNILLDRKNDRMCAQTDLLLYLAARMQLTEEFIKPALKNGEWVVLDRFNLSTYVYQCLIGNWDLSNIINIEKSIGFSIVPTSVILLDVDTETAFSRMESREQDRQEARGIEFHKKIRERYLSISKSIYKKELTVIKTDKNPSDVKDEIIRLINSLL
jgi:dTMP kinase